MEELDLTTITEQTLLQYVDAPNLKAIVLAEATVMQSSIIEPLLVMLNAKNVNNIQYGFLLDSIGHLIGMERPFIRSDDAEYWGFEGTQNEGGRVLGQAPIYTLESSLEDIVPIGNRTYALMIRARIRKLRGGTGRKDIEDCLDILFHDGWPARQTDGSVQVTIQTQDLPLFRLIEGDYSEIVLPLTAGVNYSFIRQDIP